MTNNPKTRGISRSILILTLGIIIGGSVIGFAVFFFLQQGAPAQQSTSAPKPAQTPATLTKFNASGISETYEHIFLSIDAGNDRGIWAKNGLDPEFITIPGRYIRAAELKEMVPSVFKIGYSSAGEVLLARSNGVPIKVVASVTGVVSHKLYVTADSPTRTIRDLDGKKIGVTALNSSEHRMVGYVSNQTGIRTDAVPLGESLSNKVAALKTGRIDAFISIEGAAMRLVDSGELVLLARTGDLLSRPFVGYVVFASDDLIAQNPDLVKRYVKATLESLRYLKDHLGYASDLYIKRTNAPKDLADVVVVQPDWTPDGRGSGQDLVLAARIVWQYTKDSGAISISTWEKVKIEDAVDTRFLP